GQVAYSFPSDGRFKNNITESDVKGLEFIKLLRPVEYNFDTKKFEEFLTKNMPDSTKARHFEDTDFSASTAIRQSGFVAQEVEQAMEESGYNFNGVHAPADENDNYSVAYSLFVVPLVKGMQEQQMMIEELKLALEQSQNEKVQMQFDFETRLTSIENRLLNKEQR
ncbi:MAG: tail fiber domain-containing protein, partial [Flavobacteriales bacterium]|nr:tail fiber domain-containing protein [Flavobacteriales bacterium]